AGEMDPQACAFLIHAESQGLRVKVSSLVEVVDRKTAKRRFGRKHGLRSLEAPLGGLLLGYVETAARCGKIARPRSMQWLLRWPCCLAIVRRRVPMKKKNDAPLLLALLALGAIAAATSFGPRLGVGS